MLKKLIEILNRPFPIVESNKEKAAISVFFGLFVYFFLIVFQPFGLDKFQGNKLIYFAGYGLITTFVILFNSFITVKIFNDFFKPENWNVWKSFIENLTMIVPIALLNWLYFILTDGSENYDFSFMSFIFMTFAIGVFPSFFLVFYLESSLRNSNVRLSEKVKDNLNSRSPAQEEKTKVTLVGDTKIPYNDLLCIKAAGNYVVYYFLKNKTLKKEIVRTTMKKIEESLSGSETIVRCHKSYFVNLGKVSSVSGNAQSLFLRIDELDFPVPVSRKAAKSIISGTFDAPVVN